MIFIYRVNTFLSIRVFIGKANKYIDLLLTTEKKFRDKTFHTSMEHRRLRRSRRKKGEGLESLRELPRNKAIIKQYIINITYIIISKKKKHIHY